MRAVPGSFAGRLALIVAAGAVLRVLYTVLVAPWPPEFSDDQVFYNLQAHLLADGRGFIQPQLALAGVVRQSERTRRCIRWCSPASTSSAAATSSCSG